MDGLPGGADGMSGWAQGKVHFAAEAAIDVGVFVAGVVGCIAIGVGGAAGIVQRQTLVYGIDWIAVHSVGDGQLIVSVFGQFAHQAHRGDVIVIVVSAAAVAAAGVEFADQVGIVVLVVDAVLLGGVVDHDAVDGHGDGALAGGGAGAGGHDGVQGNAFVVERLGNGYLLVPGSDADHHVVVG